MLLLFQLCSPTFSLALLKRKVNRNTTMELNFPLSSRKVENIYLGMKIEGEGKGGASITSQEAVLVRVFNLSHCKGESLIKPTYILFRKYYIMLQRLMAEAHEYQFRK